MTESESAYADGSRSAADEPAASAELPPSATPDRLSPISRRFVQHWGEMGSRWGVNRTVAQIHALLFLTGRPLDAEEIADTLKVARSNVSTSLRELMNYNLVSVVHLVGERREHFATSGDVWTLFRTVVRERKTREFDPTVGMLEGCVADPAFSGEDLVRRHRIEQTLEFTRVLSGWSEQMLRLKPATLMQIMKLGNRIEKLLRLADSE